jgi:hypothetical protein
MKNRLYFAFPFCSVAMTVMMLATAPALVKVKT